MKDEAFVEHLGCHGGQVAAEAVEGSDYLFKPMECGECMCPGQVMLSEINRNRPVGTVTDGHEDMVTKVVWC